MSQEFEPEPNCPVKCVGDGCEGRVVGYQKHGYHSATMCCLACAEAEWQKEIYRHNRLMAADRAFMGDESFVKLVIDDATVQQAGFNSVTKGKFYILTFNCKITDITGSSGYAETPELAWTQMADKIDKYMREPYR